MSRTYKIFVNAPEAFTEKIINAMAAAGAGLVENYTHCSFVTKGVGSSKPKEGSNPFYGKVGELNYEPEDKIEMPCTEENLKTVIKAIQEVHPYEIPIIEVVETQIFT